MKISKLGSLLLIVGAIAYLLYRQNYPSNQQYDISKPLAVLVMAVGIYFLLNR